MKTFRVFYNGNCTQFKGFETEVQATTEREAVEKVFAQQLDDNYFPHEDGTIKDCNGDILADPEDSYIEYDGGCFEAEEEPSTDKNDYEIFEFMSGYFGICRKGRNGANCVFGGDSACEDHYNRAYIQGVYDKWDGRLSWQGKYGYRIETE